MSVVVSLPARLRASRVMVMVMAMALGAGCAATGNTLAGEGRGRSVAITASGAIAEGKAKLQVAVENLSRDPIGVEIDAVRLDDGQGRALAPLGRPQRFRTRDGRSSVRRVPHEAAMVEPGAKQSIELEFRLAGGPAPMQAPVLGEVQAEAWTLVVPTIYRLVIDGRRQLAPLRLRLAPADPSSSATARAASAGDAGSSSPSLGDGAWFDPFEAW